MQKIVLVFLLVTAYCLPTVHAQETGIGIGFYPTGTESGFGLRSSKNARLAVDLRITRANLFINPESGSWVNEASLIYRAAYYERVRMHLGLGARMEWSISRGLDHKPGFVVPFGVEAFPFPFQTAGLFFETAPFCMFGSNGQTNVGIRTVAGFVFYFARGASQQAK